VKIEDKDSLRTNVNLFICTQCFIKKLMIKKNNETANQSPSKSSSSQEQESLANLEKVLIHFVQTFESSAHRWEQTAYPFIKSLEASTRRWERMVYPAIIISGILALSGFWLIYSLTMDVHELARNVDPKMAHNLAIMSKHISTISTNIDAMTTEIKDMKIHMAGMNSSILIMQKDMSTISTKLDTMPPLLLNISEMNQSMKAMTMNTGIMSQDIGRVNQNIGRPISFMNTFAPW